jgi:hypothetical protein
VLLLLCVLIAKHLCFLQRKKSSEMTTSTTTFLLKPSPVKKQPSVATKQTVGTSTITSPARKRLSLIQKPAPALSLNPVARLLEQASTKTNPDQLKQFENQLVALQLDETQFPLLWQALSVGSVQTKSWVIMVFLRTGLVARPWIANQLNTLSSINQPIEPWVLDFLKHQLSL